MIILIDGVCNLCNGFASFVIARDPQAQFRFAALQSDAAARLLRQHGEPGVNRETVVLLENDRLYTKSDAALRVARRLPFPWPLAYTLVVVPRPLRDWIYDFAARHRYRWFGKREVCMVPTAELHGRFLSE